MCQISIFVAFSIQFCQLESRPEGALDWLAFISTNSSNILPPNLFSHPTFCGKQGNYGCSSGLFTCYSTFISYVFGSIEIRKGITTHQCLRKAIRNEQSILGIQKENDSERLWIGKFSDYFVKTSFDGPRVAHFQQKQQGFFKQIKQVLADGIDVFKPRNVYQKHGLKDDDVLNSDCRIYGWGFEGPQKYGILSVPVKLLPAEKCQEELTYFDEDFCIDNSQYLLCHKHSEGAPILCQINGEHIIVGLANEQRHAAKDESSAPPIPVTKVYREKMRKPRNLAEYGLGANSFASSW